MRKQTNNEKKNMPLESRKIMFFDIDGTLVESGKDTIDEDVLAAIQKARKYGHLMFINTGRTLSNLSEYLLTAGFDGYICACGTYIILDGDTILYHHTPDEVCRLVKEMSAKHDLDIIYESWHGIYFDPGELKTAAGAGLASELSGLYRVFKYIPDEGFNFDKFITWNREGSDLKGFIDSVSAHYDYIDRGNGFSEFVPKGFSKATGIQFVLDRLGLDIKDAHAVGDSTNDLPMLTCVPHSIAMGNSDPKSLFDMVEYVTTDIDKNGIINALTHYGFI